MNNQRCPCCSTKLYTQCCAPFVTNEEIPTTAEQLMRSRYSAVVKHNLNYINESWHHSTRPADLNLTEQIKLNWLQLYIVKSTQDSTSKNRDYVEFVAYYSENNQIKKLHEVSQFSRQHGKWFYLDGNIIQNSNFQPGRNSPCYCGSGKKYKKCCL